MTGESGVEQKKTMFKYLHDSLVQQITSGKLAYGEQLPPLRRLCELYNVGIRTVRDVVQALAAEGYVESVQRSHVRVSYRLGGDEAELARASLARRDSTWALLKTMEAVMPHVYGEAVRHCGPALVQACRDDVAGMDQMGAKGQWRKARVALQRITGAYGNDLLEDLCIDIDLTAQVPIVPGHENPYQRMSLGAEAGLNALFDLVAAGDGLAVGAVIRRMYRDSAEAVAAHFDALHRAYPGESPEQVPYRWDAEKGRARTYMQVTRSLIKKICDGEYPDGTCLPGHAALREEYQISSYTVGKVMEALEQIKLVQKRNHHGAYSVTCGEARTKALFADGPTPVADAMTFLGAVHALALLSRGAAELGFDYLTEADVRRLAGRVEARDRPGLPDSILLTLVQAQPYQPLKAICAELMKLVEWGYYFAFAYDERAHVQTIQDWSRAALRAAGEGDRARFAGAVQGMYDYIFRVMQEMLCGLGVTGAADIRR